MGQTSEAAKILPKVSEFVRSYFHAYRYPPTIQLIADQFGIGKTQAYDVLQRMERLGEVEQRADRKYWPTGSFYVLLSHDVEAAVRRAAAIEGTTPEKVISRLVGEAYGRGRREAGEQIGVSRPAQVAQ